LPGLGIDEVVTPQMILGQAGDHRANLTVKFIEEVMPFDDQAAVGAGADYQHGVDMRWAVLINAKGYGLVVTIGSSGLAGAETLRCAGHTGVPLFVPGLACELCVYGMGQPEEGDCDN
jgi:hypothetical protein